MQGIGFWEIVVILAVAAVALGPGKLVSSAHRAGALFARARRELDGLTREISDHEG